MADLLTLDDAMTERRLARLASDTGVAAAAAIQAAEGQR